MRHLASHLGRRLVLAQPFIDDLAQEIVFGAGQEFDFGNQLGPHPQRRSGIRVTIARVGCEARTNAWSLLVSSLERDCTGARLETGSRCKRRLGLLEELPGALGRPLAHARHGIIADALRENRLEVAELRRGEFHLIVCPVERR
jgi:hypothetical protein